MIFGIPDVDAAAQFAVANAVEEINAQTDREPDNKADPCFQRQAQHQARSKRTRRELETTEPTERETAGDGSRRSRRRMITPMTNENKGKERSDVRQVGERTDIETACDAADDNAGPDRRDVRCAKSRMNPREILRQQTVARHGHENARLPKLKHEQD